MTNDNEQPESSDAGAVPDAAAPAPPPATSVTDAAPPEPHVDADTLRENVIQAIQNVYDPEIPVNIYELGLIYGVDIDDEHRVNVTMTLTSPACPAAQDLPMEVQGRIAVLPGVKDVNVDITFDPPWSPDKMSEAAKVQLGFDL